MDIEQKEKKKQRILKIIKYIGISCFLLAIILIAIGSCKKTHALEEVENYNIYTNMGEIDSISVSGTIYTISYLNDRVYYYYNNNYVYDERYQHYTFLFNSNDLVNEVDTKLKINISELDIGTIVLFGGFVDTTTETYYIDRITTITRYLDKLTDTTYQNGYEIGINTVNVSEAYNEGYNAGLQNAQDNYTNQLNTQAESYQATIDSLQQDIQYYEGIINSGTTPWGSFTSLLGTIFLFPIKFFKEGFNIDLFGVNIGGLIIGIGLIGIILAVIGLILGKRGKE